MNRSIIIGICMFAFSANAAEINDDPTELYRSSFDSKKVVIIWKTATNVQEMCNIESIKFGSGPVTNPSKACALWRQDRNGVPQGECIIITRKNVSMHTIGHEIRHCFEGHWHAK